MPAANHCHRRAGHPQPRGNLLAAIQQRRQRQTSLARKIGCSTTTICRIISGHLDPAPPLRRRLAQVLNADPVWLFDAAPLIIPRPGSSAPRRIHHPKAVMVTK